MRIVDVLLAELEQESHSTARVLERVPQAHLSWRPHATSMSLGQLALHVATIPGNVAALAAMDIIPEPPKFIPAEAASAAELVPTLEASVDRGRVQRTAERIAFERLDSSTSLYRHQGIS